MKFDGFDFNIDKNTIHLLPTIKLVFNEYFLCYKNFSVQFHWLCFHSRIRWIKGE